MQPEKLPSRIEKIAKWKTGYSRNRKSLSFNSTAGYIIYTICPYNGCSEWLKYVDHFLSLSNFDGVYVRTYVHVGQLIDWQRVTTILIGGKLLFCGTKKLLTTPPPATTSNQFRLNFTTTCLTYQIKACLSPLLSLLLKTSLQAHGLVTSYLRRLQTLQEG